MDRASIIKGYIIFHFNEIIYAIISLYMFANKDASQKAFSESTRLDLLAIA